MLTLVLKGSLHFKDELADKGFHPFHHDDEIIVAFIHVVDLALAEIAAVKYKGRLPVTVTFCLGEHHLYLRDIDDASGIILIKELLRIFPVKCDRVIKYGLACVFLGVPVFNEINVAGLAVLVRGVVGDINFLPVVALDVPLILECDTLIPREAVYEIRDLRIAVYLHLAGEKLLVERIVRISTDRRYSRRRWHMQQGQGTAHCLFRSGGR